MSDAAAAPSIYDTYNAKWLSPPEVAKSFVPPLQFVRLLRRHNSLIVGPRGSGKTTLLKMLTLPALAEQTHPRVERLKKHVDYTGVFVATDVSWNSQVSALGSGRLDPASREMLQMGALAAHTHKALIEAMEFRAHVVQRERDFSRARAASAEVTVVQELARLWKLAPRLPSFQSMRAALRARLQGMHELAKGEGYADTPGRAERLASKEPSLLIPLLLSCRNAVEQFNDVYEKAERYWAFLFDELELMPTPIRNELYRYLRTFPGPLVFKLAICPFDDALPEKAAADSPQRDADFDFIPLWYGKKRRAYSFCRELWYGMVQKRSLGEVSPEEGLGRSLIDTDGKDWAGQGTAYTDGSPHQRRLKELAATDASFRGYLRHHSIDLRRINEVKGTERASTLRKVYPLVVARLARTRPPKDEKSEGQLRSRKVSEIYTGATGIFDICEGNPRLFIGLVSRMLDRLADGETVVPRVVQVDEITQAVNRFRALLRTIVVPNVSATKYRKGLLSLLDPAGEALQTLSLVASFSPEPPGAFLVDSRTDPDLIVLLGYAINSGAAIHAPDADGDEQLLSSSEVRGKRLRLSYLLAAYYGIPPRLGRSIALSELLRGAHSDVDEQEGLFERGTVL